MDVVKITLQAQRHSMVDPMDVPKYRNAAHAAYSIVKEEGFSALYKGVTLTALRQGKWTLADRSTDLEPFQRQIRR
jgi:solute carrier family 25 citrate transporter 1